MCGPASLCTTSHWMCVLSQRRPPTPHSVWDYGQQGWDRLGQGGQQHSPNTPRVAVPGDRGGSGPETTSTIPTSKRAFWKHRSIKGKQSGARLWLPCAKESFLIRHYLWHLRDPVRVSLSYFMLTGQKKTRQQVIFPFSSVLLPWQFTGLREIGMSMNVFNSACSSHWRGRQSLCK